MVRDHQPGQAVFRSILLEDIDRKPFPAFPPSARLAVLVGEPSQAGPYLIRVEVPLGVKLMPHRHPKTSGEGGRRPIRTRLTRRIAVQTPWSEWGIAGVPYQPRRWRL